MSMRTRIRHSLTAATLVLAGLGLSSPQASAEDKVVRVWHTETQPETITAFNAIARRFEAQNPGVRIEAEGLGWADLEGKITAALAAGTPPELSHGQPITCTALQEKGLLLPLDAVVEAIGEGNVWWQVRPVCNVGGQQFGLVHAVGTSLMIYRKDMADALGIKPPVTWADHLAAVRALTQDTDGDGKIDVYGVTIPGDNLFINILVGELIKANAGALFDSSNRPLLTDRRMIEVLEYLRELLKYAPPGWEGHGYPQTYQNLYSGKAAVMPMGYGRGAGLIERYTPKDMANDTTFGVWVKPHGASGNAAAVQADEEPWMLFKSAKHSKEAIAFLKFFYQDDNYLEYVSTVPIHLLPITESLRKSDKYRNLEMFKRWQSWLDVQQSYLDNDQAKPTLVTEWSDLNSRPYLLSVLDSGILRDMVMDVVAEKQAPEDAARKAQDRLETFLRGKGYLAPGPAPKS